MCRTVLVRGAGDVGSAVAHVLHAAGYRVVIHDHPAPSHGRRAMAFVDAIFEGSCTLEGTLAKRAGSVQDLAYMAECRKAVAVSVDALLLLVDTIRPDVVVDARMRKRSVPEAQMHLAPVTIGLGLNFIAGTTTHLAIETAWGEHLGEVIQRGTALPLQGEPRQLGGFGRERFVYAPAHGAISTSRIIGEWVEAGEVVARLGATPLHAPIAGYLRGLTHSGVVVDERTKVIEIDPRRAGSIVRGIGERPRRIAEGVLAALRR
jgi:xanthine dehydrogenase accessory factor